MGDAADVAYPGGKNGAGVYQRLINLMPPHRVYIEPFLGGGAIMRLKRAAPLSIGLDLDLEALAMAMPPEGSSRIAMRDRAPSDSVIAAEIARIGDGGSATIRIDDGGSSIFIHGDGIRFLEAYPFRGNELVYCDPPYMMETRSGRRLYAHELSEGGHRRFLRVVMGIAERTKIMISGYYSALYGKMLEAPIWQTVSFEAMTRGGRTATEWLWFNFDPPKELHDYRYLGQNFRERERIKRKKARWTARLARMEPLERAALMLAMQHSNADSDANSSFTIKP